MDNSKRIPRHIAIILDGNGRWAKLRNKPRSYGHKVGFDNIKAISIYASKLGIEALSMFCFSTENWNRPKEEVNYLMSLPIEFEKDIDAYLKENIKVMVSGRKDRIPIQTLNSLNNLQEKTSKNTGMILNICFDYGALDDLCTAVNSIINSGNNNIGEMAIYSHLSTSMLPKVDLLIRTGGEMRLSNFLLLESAYAELYFVKTYWPDFKEKDLDLAIDEFQLRNRRFGGIKE